MSFEVLEHDVLGRIGRLQTKSGTVETPMMLPVVNPSHQLVPARELRSKFGYDALITNAYLVKRKFGAYATKRGIHKLLGFDGVVATDSGAYQILEYGNVDVSPQEILRFQESLGSDIAVILDVPTGHDVDKAHAKQTVDETIRRADEALQAITKRDILWVGPVQGGGFLDLIAHSAHEMAQRGFAYYALGSPTPIMEEYQFDKLVDMVMAAKTNLPIDKPLHLFGAGHPMMLALAVALGCDIFDSAAYALFARHGRYLTESGTLKLSDMRYFPCPCDACKEFKPTNLLHQSSEVREGALARHNLNVTAQEVARIKEAILEGRLWELIEQRSLAHPTMKAALTRLAVYQKFLARHSPTTKSKGIFVFGHESLTRPEVTIHRERITENYSPPPEANICLLAPRDSNDPKSSRNAVKRLRARTTSMRHVHLCYYSVPYGVIPADVEWTFPLGQTATATPYSKQMIQHSAKVLTSYIRRKLYKKAILVHGAEKWHVGFASSFRTACEMARTPHRVLKMRSGRDAQQIVKILTGVRRGPKLNPSRTRHTGQRRSKH